MRPPPEDGAAPVGAASAPSKEKTPKIAAPGERVTIYTDGACSGNPGPGGWGALLILGAKEKELSGGEPATTNNRMELTADNKPVKNEDLWRRLDAARARHQVAWHWVRGHAGDPRNERVDALARSRI